MWEILTAIKHASFWEVWLFFALASIPYEFGKWCYLKGSEWCIRNLRIGF